MLHRLIILRCQYTGTHHLVMSSHCHITRVCVCVCVCVFVCTNACAHACSLPNDTPVPVPLYGVGTTYTHHVRLTTLLYSLALAMLGITCTNHHAHTSHVHMHTHTTFGCSVALAMLGITCTIHHTHHTYTRARIPEKLPPYSLALAMLGITCTIHHAHTSHVHMHTHHIWLQCGIGHAGHFLHHGWLCGH